MGLELIHRINLPEVTVPTSDAILIVIDNLSGEPILKKFRVSNIQGGQGLPTTAFDGLSKITVGTTQPSNPSVGDLWVDTN